MKNKLILLPVLLITLLVIACSSLVEFGSNGNTIKPSDIVISEERQVSGFNGINMSTFGQILLTQGESESLNIKGSNNIVPVIKTTVRNGVLFIEKDKSINITGMNSDNVLVFTITVKDLTSLTISGAGEVEMGSLSTTGLDVTMSGAGQFQLDQLTAESVNINLSGVGGVNVAGEVKQATIEISGTGNVSAPDLKCQTAEVNIPGLGDATVWVTDMLSGNISGSGSVSYYGDPETNTETTGLGKFKHLGSK